MGGLKMSHQPSSVQIFVLSNHSSQRDVFMGTEETFNPTVEIKQGAAVTPLIINIMCCCVRFSGFWPCKI